MKKFLLSLLSIALFGASYAQVSVDINSQTVTELIQDVLVGEGVDVFNVQINGQPGNQIHVQAGAFGDPSASVGLESGLIMGSGNVTLAEGPNDNTAADIPGVPSQYSYAPLEALANVDVNDQCVVEFDFIPQGDTLRFNYIFASEEYPEFGCSGFNDVFGFFLSGNIPSGGVYNNENIALVPDPDNIGEFTDIPVAINSINDGMNGTPANCEEIAPDYLDYVVYYVSNEGDDYQYDGRTVSLTAQALVNCGEVYHIVLAIGDGGDQVYDSGVFLEAGSFEAQPTGLSAESLFPLGLVEISNNCDSGFARIGRPCGADTMYYQLNYLDSDSSATYGVDYLDLPTELFMPLGVTELFFPIETVPDGEVEPTEWICIELLESTIEGGPFTIIDTACVAILDNYTFPVLADDEPLYCPESLPYLDGMPQFPGVAPFIYSWTLNGEEVSSDNPYEAPVPPNYGDSVLYELQVTDFCGAVNDPTDAIVSNNVPGDPSLSIAATGEYCPGVGYELSADQTGGTFPFTYIWTDALGGTYPNEASITVDPYSDYGPIGSIEYMLRLEDACNPTRSAESSTVVTFPEPISTELYSTSLICIDQVQDLQAVSSGGYPPYSYVWEINPELIPTQYFPINYGIVPGTNGEAQASGFYVDQAGNADNEFLVNVTVGDWCSALQSPLFSLHPPAMDTDTITALDCIYPNVVSPNGDNLNDSFIVNELINRRGTMFIYNRWGNLMSESSSNEWKISDEPDGTYYYVVQFDDNEKNNKRTGYFTIVR